VWSILIILSVLAGLVCGWILPERRSVVWGAAVPWLGVLAWLLYNEYFVPYRGGGASMWPIAQLLGGTAAALIGTVAASVARAARAKSLAARQ
jgi:hypothetical protein